MVTKTRVAVQSLVELISAREIHGPILWVAQTEELCEQAMTECACSGLHAECLELGVSEDTCAEIEEECLDG